MEKREKVIKCPKCKGTELIWRETRHLIHFMCGCGFEERWNIS